MRARITRRYTSLLVRPSPSNTLICRQVRSLQSTADGKPESESKPTSESTTPPFPFLWPSFPEPPLSCPHSFPPIISANPNSILDKIYISAMSLGVKFPGLTRALNLGWCSMLLTRRLFPTGLLEGSVRATDELLKRINEGGDVSELTTPEFSEFLRESVKAEEDGTKASIRFGKDNEGEVGIRDVWLWLGPQSAFAPSVGKFGGLLHIETTLDSKSRTLLLQLPFTSIITPQSPSSSSDTSPGSGGGYGTPLALEAEQGLRIGVDIEFKGPVICTYGENQSIQIRTTVVRFVSQAFDKCVCTSTEDRNRRIFGIRDGIRWRIADLDYVWSSGNFLADRP